MTQATLDRLQCPCRAGQLELLDERRDADRIVQGRLACPSCAEVYSIEDGIARLLPSALREDTDEARRKSKEIAARDAQVRAYDQMVPLKLLAKVEVPMTVRRLGIRSGDWMLEAGCGTGRMTRSFAARASKVVAADFSFASLLANQRKLLDAGMDNVDLVQADVCALPFKDGAFDRTVSCQVLEHVPSADARSRAVAEFSRVTRPGGRVVVSAYQHTVFTRLMGPKEGEHAGGIYYFRFTGDEFRDLLASALSVRSISRSLLYIHLAKCDKPD